MNIVYTLEQSTYIIPYWYGKPENICSTVKQYHGNYLRYHR